MIIIELPIYFSKRTWIFYQVFPIKLTGLNYHKRLSALLKDKEMRNEKVKCNVAVLPTPHEENQQNVF